MDPMTPNPNLYNIPINKIEESSEFESESKIENDYDEEIIQTIGYDSDEEFFQQKEVVKEKIINITTDFFSHQTERASDDLKLSLDSNFDSELSLLTGNSTADFLKWRSLAETYVFSPTINIATARFNFIKLIEKGKELNLINKMAYRGQVDSMFHLLAKFGDRYIDFVEILIKAGADLNLIENRFGNTPLMWAIANAHNKMALKILEFTPEFDRVRINRENPVMAEDILSSFPSLPTKASTSNNDTSARNTPLHLAAGKGYVEGLTTNDQYIDEQSTNLRLTQVLLEKGFDPNTKGFRGFTPLHLACLTGELEMVNLLIRHGANPHLKNVDGQTAFDLLKLDFLQSCEHLELLIGPNLLSRKIKDMDRMINTDQRVAIIFEYNANKEKIAKLLETTSSHDTN